MAQGPAVKVCIDWETDEQKGVYAQKRMYALFPQLRLEFDVLDGKGHPVEHDDITGKLVEVLRELPDRL